MAREPLVRRKLRYAECKVLGHDWAEFTDYEMVAAPYGERLSVRCDRCECERHDLIARNGQLNSRHYVIPEDYSTHRFVLMAEARTYLLLHRPKQRSNITPLRRRAHG
jgi:hypothetical protein